MATRQTWKFEKDMFGKRHRKYFLENIFGSDVADMQTFRALKAKLSKDYLAFFNGIDKRYERGEHKKMAKQSVKVALATITLLGDMITNGIIDAESVGVVADNIGNLNASRDFFVQQSEQVKAVKERLGQIESETGVGPEALSISKKMVTTGAKREKKKLKEGTGAFLQRTAPKSIALGGELAKGLGTAVLGPFAPFAGMAGGALSDVFGIGKGLFEKRAERKQQRLGSSLRARAVDTSGLPLGGRGSTGVGVSLPKMIEQRKKTGAATLTDFFNKGAYKAKWTKALLKHMKKMGGGSGRLVGGFAGLVAGLAPLIGKAGLLALLGVATVATTKKLSQLVVGWNALEKAKAGAKEAEKAASRAASDKLKVMGEIGIDEFARRAGKSTRQVAIDTAGLEQREALSKMVSRPWYKKSLQALGIIKRPELVPSIRIEEIEKEFKKNVLPSPPSPETVKFPEMEKLSTSLDLLTKKMEMQVELSSAVADPGVGNIYDPSDDILNGFSGGNIELRQE